MKYIFLDIDGVLNSITFFKKHMVANKKTLVEIDCETVKNLEEIVLKTNAEIVLSSTWRFFFRENKDGLIPLDKKATLLNDILNQHNIKMVSKTDNLYSRSDEILKWLSDHEYDDYIVLDDELSHLEKIKDKVIHIDSRYGLTKKDAKSAIDKLCPNKKLLKVKK